MIYDLKTGQYEEDQQFGGGALEFLYNKPLGRLFLKAAVNPAASRLAGRYYGSSLSRGKIKKMIERYNIDMRLYEEKDYKSFNEFFIRQRKHIDIEDGFVSPADSLLTVYKITDDLMVPVKGSNYDLTELVAGKTDISSFDGGMLLVFRLRMNDYHRYIFPFDGKVTSSYEVPGVLHTVSSASSRYKIYKENQRRVSVLESKRYGQVIAIEVGALIGGRIVDNGTEVFSKGDEKGYFETGGSTIVYMIQKDRLELRNDISEKQDYEIKLGCGQRIEAI